MSASKDRVEHLKRTFHAKTPQEIISASFKTFAEKITFASSLGEEDQVITDMISKVAAGIRIFTLDTGRLFEETYQLLAKTQKRYPAVRFDIYYPDTRRVEAMVRDRGINLFYESVENRKICCGIRKIEPLKRALAGRDAWMTGLRRGQAVTRTQTPTVEWDEANNLIKINPLADWRLEDVHAYIKEHSIDINPLHARGFLSIGCACCTRAVKPGEDIRAGRWWWEQPEQKECGLHNNPNRPKSVPSERQE